MSIQSGKTTIKGFFDGSKCFNVPIYQRAYSWERPHLREFFYDLLNQRHDWTDNKRRPYFLGTFLLHVKNEDNDFLNIDIIDGQQRITTFTIFMNELIKAMEQRCLDRNFNYIRRTFIKDGDIYKLTLSQNDRTFFTECILENKDYHAPMTYPSQRLLKQAQEYFVQKLATVDDAELERLYKTVTEAEVLLYSVEEVSMATQIFELLNDRGKKLSDLESIKSFLMYNLSSVSNNPEQLIGNIQNNFAEIYRIIEQYRLSSYDETDILRYHTIAFELQGDVDPKKYIKDKVRHLLLQGKDEEAKEFIISYPAKLLKTFNLYIILRWNKLSLPVLDDLHQIGRVAPFYPLLLRTLAYDKERIERLLKYLIRFTFKATFIGLRSNGESYLNTALKKNEDIVETVRCMTDNNWWNINDRAVSALSDVNFYEWHSKNIVKYILFKYENHLRGNYYALLTSENYYSDDERRKLSIEHISACRALKVVYDKDFNENYLHNIGNLVIDCKASNSSKGNKNTQEKLEAFNDAPIMSQHEIDNCGINWNDVGSIKQFINDRERRLKEFVKEKLFNPHL